MSHKTTINTHAVEGQTAVLVGKLVDENGVGIALSQLDTLEFWLYDKVTGTIINDRQAINIKNLNGGTFSATGGDFTMTLVPLDMALVDANKNVEIHVAQFRWSYAAAAKFGAHEIEFPVYNIRDWPA